MPTPFRLLGYDNLDYGSEIDWHPDVVHGKRTPPIPWFKINFLDFSEAGDHKITWELSRHQHLVTLAEAWLLSNREKYANEAVEQWYSWQRSNPYPLGVNWASGLEVTFRTLSWLWLPQLLARSTILTVSYQKDLLRALALNGRHIDRYLSTYFSPNTHLVGEAVALFLIGTLCPQISAAEKGKKQAWRIIQDEAQRQVRPDGVYFEQSLYYHVYALDFLLHARLLASCNGIEIPSGFDKVVRKMLAVVQAVSQVGPPDGFGDDDGGRVFNPRRNRAEHMAEPLAIGAAVFQDERLRANAALTLEAIWLFGAEAVQWTAQSDEIPNGPESQSYKDGGLYIAASRDPFLFAPLDQYPSWNNVDANDSVPFVSSTYTTSTPITTAWQNEIQAISLITGSAKRIAHTFITARSQIFDDKEAIGQVSQDGRFFMFSSDWMGTLGSESGSSSCTIGLDCRGDVFVVKLN